MALLVSHILKTNPHILEATSYSKISIGSKNKGHEAQNTNKVLNKIPNVLASKTGYTQLSGGNVVLALNAGIDHPIIISVLGSSYDGRFNDLNALVKATLEYLTP
jgi:D-alanyl-D-alanine carboxypeptidase